jgi:uncharacterized membrane protein YhaH (DUF805 family)
MDIAKDILNKDFLLNYEGRINRQPYWMFVLVMIGGAFVIGFLSAFLGKLGTLIGVLYNLAIIYPSIIVQIKRWHDRGKSGWWCLINLVPVIGWIWGLVECGFLPGTPGPNEYGPDPLGGSSAPPV